MPLKIEKPTWPFEKIFWVLILGVIIAFLGFFLPLDATIVGILYIFAAVLIGFDATNKKPDKATALIIMAIMIVVSIIFSAFNIGNDLIKFLMLCAEIGGIEINK